MILSKINNKHSFFGKSIDPKKLVNKQKICLVAVDVRSAHNIGSIFRTCDGFDAELFLIGICPRPKYSDDTRLPHVGAKNEKAISKTALGAEKSVKWRYSATLQECIKILKKEAFTVVAVEQHKQSKPLSQFISSGNVAIVVGREVEGLHESELLICDSTYEIPMKGNKESFNVSVVAGIGLYQIKTY